MTDLLRNSIAIAAMPVAVLSVLLEVGAVRLWPALTGIAVTVIGAYGLALIWASDLAVLVGRLQAAADGGQREARAMRVLRLDHPLVLELGRLSQALEERAELVARRLRSEASIIERLPDPLLVLGLDRSVRRSNAAARGVLGGELAAVLRHPAMRAAIDAALAQPDEGGAVQVADLVLPAPVRRELQATILRLASPLSDGGRLVCVLSDRTRERGVERMRADFVANASHELRTPLASLIGFIDTLAGPAADDPPAQRRFLGIMAEQAARMSRLIDDLLSLSRVELSEHLPPSDTVDLAGLVSRAAAAFELRLAERQIALSWTPPAGQPLPKVIGDQDQLSQVLHNLLDNAIKYGRDGGALRLRLHEPDAADTRWPPRPGIALAVQDDGIGIPQTDLPRLTERFYRVDRARSRSVGGTGLGLAIVKHIVNRHRGQLIIESEAGAGSTFTVWLPVE